MRWWYPWAMAGLGLFCVILAISNVSLVLSHDHLLHEIETADGRIAAEGKARVVGNIQNCYQSAIMGPRVNVLVHSIEADHRARARQAELLAKADPTKKLRDAHLLVAAQQRRIATALPPFPVPKTSQCDREARKVGGETLMRQLRRSAIVATKGDRPR